MSKNIVIEINSKFLKHNLDYIVRNTNKNIIAVLKANAYGHGIAEVFELLFGNGINYFAVYSMDEASEIRRISSKAKIIVLDSVINDLTLREAIKLNVELVCSEIESFKTIENFCKKNGLVKFNFQVEFNLGLNRQGITYDEKLVKQILSNDYFNINGVFSQISVNNINEDDQLVKIWTTIVKQFKQSNEKCISHIICSATFDYVNNSLARLDTHIRIGDLIYGFGRQYIKPIINIRSYISHINHFTKGEKLGYAQKYILDSDKKIASIPVGFSDGLPREIVNHYFVYVKDKRVAIIGEIFMNCMLIDCTGIDDLSIGDEVYFISQQTPEDDLRYLSSILHKKGSLITTALSSKILRRIV
jgi:alanine racemase